MNDMDMIFLFQQYLGETDLSFLEGADKKAREEKNEDKESDKNDK